MNERAVIVILADGARADVFERLLAEGRLPQIAQHVVERGAYRRATSTFTSTTIPAHLPMLTGQFAGTANVPGYRWFERGAHRPGLPLGPWCQRSYNGPEAMFVNRDIAATAPTLFELVPGSKNVFGAITRGVGKGDNLAAGRKNRLWVNAHYRHDYVNADLAAHQVLLQSVRDDHARSTQFWFAVFPGIDWNSHYSSPFAPQTEAAYGRVDHAVGEIAAALQRSGRYEDTLLVICSDHGHCPVDEHFGLPVRLEQDHGLRVAYHSLRALRHDAEVVASISGNAMAHVYVRGDGNWHDGPLSRSQLEAAVPGVIERLLGEPAIDILATRADDGSLEIASARGRATLRETATGLSYTPVARPAGGPDGAIGDPFGYPPLPSELTHEQSLKLTFDSNHPDGLLQLAQIFRSPRCGDIVVSAAPGYDLRERFEHPEHRSSHGALHHQHMHVPLAFSAPVNDGPARTSDIFSTAAAWLDIAATTGVDGQSRLS